MEIESEGRVAPATTGDVARPSGEMLSRISTSIVSLYHDHFGKGPTGAKTYVLDDLVICVLRDGLTTLERTLFERGKADTVREMRSAFQDAVADRFTGAVEEVTKRRVVAFMSQAHINPDLAIEVFFLDGKLEANGSLEIDHSGDVKHGDTGEGESEGSNKGALQ